MHHDEACSCNGGESLATLCPFWAARESNPRPYAPLEVSLTTMPTGRAYSSNIVTNLPWWVRVAAGADRIWSLRCIYWYAAMRLPLQTILVCDHQQYKICQSVSSNSFTSRGIAQVQFLDIAYFLSHCRAKVQRQNEINKRIWQSRCRLPRIGKHAFIPKLEDSKSASSLLSLLQLC